MNVLVTGCSRGVGLEICRVLLEQGNTVYGVARSYSDEFKALEADSGIKLSDLNHWKLNMRANSSSRVLILAIARV